ncbi:BrxA family protein, partial [Halomonas sp. AOP7-E1-9]
AKRIAQAIRKRLERLEPPFWQALSHGDEQLATQVAFCAALARNLLLLEFLESVVADAFVTRAEALQPYLWEEFLTERTERDPTIARWADSSRKKMGQVVFRMLCEVGLITDNRHRRIQPLVVRHDVLALLERHRQDRIRHCLLALRPR